MKLVKSNELLKEEHVSYDISFHSMGEGEGLGGGMKKDECILPAVQTKPTYWVGKTKTDNIRILRSVILFSGIELLSFIQNQLFRNQ